MVSSAAAELGRAKAVETEEEQGNSMPSVSLSFGVHQPWRVKRYSFFSKGEGGCYFDEVQNRKITQTLGEKCYLPANEIILKLIQRYEGAFRVAFAMSGVAVEQMREYAPEVLDSFVRLANTGCVEFLAGTYYHSLASLYDQEEFKEQVKLHCALMQEVFRQKPRVFSNTDLIYSDQIGRCAADMGFKAVLAEGAEDILGWRSSNLVYTIPGTENETGLLLRNFRLSDDIALRFSSREWSGWPLTTDKFANWVHRSIGSGDVVNLCLDYATFGEHQAASTGILEFLEHLPEGLLNHPHWSILTPSQIIDTYSPSAELPFHRIVSSANQARDISAWSGNRMQASSIEQVFQLGREVKQSPLWNECGIRETWRRLLSSDHFTCMGTKWFSDGDELSYVSPYESPYEAFVNYMNVLRDAGERWTGAKEESAPMPVTKTPSESLEAAPV